MAKAPDNTRQHQRRTLPLLVQYRFNPVGDFHTDYSVNISGGGLLLHMLTAPQLGATVYLQFIMRGDSRIIQCRGRVVRVETVPSAQAPVSAAVQFIDLDDDDYEAILRLVTTAGGKPRASQRS